MPGMMPVTAPEEVPMVAMIGLLLLQTPPPASVSVSAMPTHKWLWPVMAAGCDVTVTVVVVGQPLTE